MQSGAGQEQRRPKRTDAVTRNVEHSMDHESAAADHRGRAHQSRCSCFEWHTLPKPPDEKDEQEQRRKPAQFDAGPEPVALGMDDIVVRDRILSMDRENRWKISQTDSEHRPAQEQGKRVLVNAESPGSRRKQSFPCESRQRLSAVQQEDADQEEQGAKRECRQATRRSRNQPIRMPSKDA